MPYYVYVIKSLSKGTQYVGSASDVQKRLSDHNAGRSNFTKGYRPWVLVHKEEFTAKAEALRRERYLKSGKGREVLKKIIK
jgi:putative endonuclease